MYIKSMHIENYRNLRDVTLHFHESMNYLVGENAIGKSSFLRLLSLICKGQVIPEQDYADVTRPIVVTLELVLLRPGDQGFAFDRQEDRRTVTLRLEKNVEEFLPRLYNLDSGELVPPEIIRCVRYLENASFHDPGETPVWVYRAVEEKLETVLHVRAENLTPCIREFITREVQVGNRDTSYYVNIFLLSRYLRRQDCPVADNMKFISLVALRLLTQIYEMMQSHAAPLERSLIINENGERLLPLWVSIDEPEIHLHPYMQRSILQYYQELLENRDPKFCKLLHELFHIDGLRGQLFVVTHATDSLAGDYRHIIRFYRNDAQQVQAACGSAFSFDEEIEKHLLMHFPEVKESLYSRSVLIVEGETEYGCFRYFGKTLQVPFDYYGICLINARGESSIGKIKTLLEAFHIPVAALYDGDVKRLRCHEKQVYFTDEICFEMDLVTRLLQVGKRRELDRIINAAAGGHGRATADMLKRACRKLAINYHDYPPKLLQHVNSRNYQALCVYYFAWLYSNKGVILGRLIGQSLQAEEIPPAFCRVICAAGTFASVRGKQEKEMNL